MKWVWLLFKSNSLNKWHPWQMCDAGLMLARIKVFFCVMNSGTGHVRNVLHVELWVKWL